MLEERDISILAYNLETILAEKLETILSRADQNTRPRDYYDVYILRKLQFNNICATELKAALYATTEKRGSTNILSQYKKIMEVIRNSDVMQKQWLNYQKNFEYANDILFMDTCAVIKEIMEELYGE